MNDRPAFRRRALALLCATVLSLLAACASNRGGPADPPTTATQRTPGAVARIETSPLPDATSDAAEKFDGCDTCHIDVADEVVHTRHQAKGVTCARCHGKSIGHVRDENNEVKPDRVFTRRNTDKWCGVCHQCSRPGAAKPPARPGPDHKTCTDCHGSHKIVRQGKPARS